MFVCQLDGEGDSVIVTTLGPPCNLELSHMALKQNIIVQ